MAKLLDPAFREGIVSTSAQQFSSSTQEHDRRRATSRVLPKSLIYVACGAANGGMVLNVSDDGMAISMAIAVGDEAYKNLHVRMNGLPQSLEVRGRMAWTTASKKRAGIQLVDVSASQRERIREWIALDGVRDVNLMPRVEEARVEKSATGEKIAASPMTMPLASTEAREAVADESAGMITGEKAVRVANPAIFPVPHPSLLDLFGGTAPESLGPPLPERFANEDGALPGEPSLGFGTVSKTAFRENEWDLASVTMVPRKTPRPEGLSAVALILLWVAIPSFGIGILVGRRPLEHWLATGQFTEPQIPASANAEGGAVGANEALGVPGLPKPVAVEPSQFTESAALEAPVAAGGRDSQDVGDSKRVDGEALKDFSNSMERGGDSKLLNSLSTQEARAFRNAPAKPLVVDSESSSIPPTDSSRNSASIAVRQNIAPSVKPVVPPVVVAHNFADADRRAAMTQSVRPDISISETPKTVATNSTVGAVIEVAKTPAPANVPPAKATSMSVAHVSVASNSGSASSPNVAISHSSDGNLNLNGGQSAPTVTAASPTIPTSSSVSNVGASGVAASPVTNSSAAVPGATPMNATAVPARMNPAGAAPAMAAVTTQPPLHGTMLVARKSDESFLLKLPMESVPTDNSVAARMQRVVLVPPRSGWHGHGPIVKVAIGELLSKAELDQPDANVKPRVGEAVTVRAYVDKNGEVSDLKPVSGRFALMPRVMRAVRDWQFDQTRIDGQPVDSEVDVVVEFRR